MWELISASSDTVPLRSHLRNNNGSSQFLQWPGGGGGSGGVSSQLSVDTRLERLQHHFNSLRVFDEDCRQRLLCEIAESPHKFAPLTNAFLDETRWLSFFMIYCSFLTKSPENLIYHRGIKAIFI